MEHYRINHHSRCDPFPPRRRSLAGAGHWSNTSYTRDTGNPGHQGNTGDALDTGESRDSSYTGDTKHPGIPPDAGDSKNTQDAINAINAQNAGVPIRVRVRWFYLSHCTLSFGIPAWDATHA